MKKYVFIFLFLFSFTKGFTQPINDNCNTATNLGSLPTPAACPSGVGATVSVSGTTVNATASSPYFYLLGCQTGGNQTPNALDVWYSFTATGNLVTLNLSGTIPSPNVALWTGTCGSLNGYDCAIGTNAGNLTVTFQPTTPGQTYLLQISGNNTNASGTFSFTLNNDNDCSNCLQTSSLTINPPPTNGTYLPGTTVNFCYTVSSYTQVSANWLHGVVPSFGCGWNLATLTPGTPPADCAYDPTPGPGNAGAGTWGWYNSVTGSATGATYGPGFFFDNINVAGTNPGQNFGDPTNGNCTWTFCWSITTSANCTGCTDLSMSINTLADGESGSWNSPACSGDPEYQFSSSLSCCQAPIVTRTNVSCFGSCNATATATPTGTASPWDYNWTGPSGYSATFNNLAGPNTINGLCPGTYTVLVTDNNNCTSTSTVTITQPTAISATSTQGTIACNGGTATATVIPSGGTSPYSYAWSPSGGTGATSTALIAGSYSFTITDANGCTVVRNITFTQPSTLSATNTQGTIACNGGTATATVTPSGGTSPYSYAWSPSGGTGATSTALIAGSYSCTITDSNGCTTVRNITLTQPSALSATSTQGAISCNSGTATATVTPSGGTSPYFYAWSPIGGSGATSTALTAGIYSCNITDANGCTTVRNITLTQPSALSATSTQGTIACNGGTATATVTPSGGTSTYTYAWSPSGGSGATSTALTAGSYSCTITDANGCTVVRSITLTQPSALSATSTQGVIACNGGTATATVTPSGGTSPYSYAWSPSGGTGATSTALIAGSYSCTITDANGCTVVRNITFTQPSVLSATSTQGTIACNGGSATATVTPTGGTSPYSYAWSPSGGTGATSTALTAGSYSCTITDAYGCTVVRNITLTQPSALSATSVQGTIACNGGTATATVTPSGGTSPYTYAWSPSCGTGATSNALTAGSYSCTITDANGCTTVRNITIAQSSLLSTSASSVPASCNTSNGSATVVASGGTSPYSYLWSPSGGSASTAIGLSGGNYSVTVTDANGCTSSSNVVVASASSPVAAISTISNVICNGGSNGSVSLSVSGGNTPYTYTWSPSVSVSSGASSLTAGNYSVIVTGSNGCTTTINFAISQPTALISTGTQGTIACNGGTATATVSPSGGTSPYTYAWSPIGGTGATSNALTAGSYSCTITDANGCTVVRNVTITQPSAISATSTQGTIACNGGTATATVTPSGGTSPYSYAWSPSGGTGATSTALTAGSYNCTITDANGCAVVRNITLTQPSALSATSTQVTIACNGGTATATVTPSGGTSPYTYAWSPSGGSGATSTALTAGSYSCTITDANGCTVFRNVTLTQPSAISATSTQGTIACNGGSATATVSPTGGTSPYSYAWSPSGGTGATSTALASGSYSCTITDANGCTVVRNITLAQPSAISATSTQGTIACNGGTATATVTPSGGTLPYAYAWSPSGGTGATSTALTAGSYSCTITDANGCTVLRNITISQPNLLSASTSFVSATCNVANGSATVVASGGTAPFSYSWSPIGGAGATASGLNAGTYSVLVTDANGCTASSNVVVSSSGAPQAIVSSVLDVSCNGGNNGSASLSVSGGVLPYGYVWSPAVSSTSSANNLSAGNYTVIISGSNGCTSTINISITQPATLTTSSTQGIIACNGGTATATVTPNGGTAPFTYAWSPIGGTAALSTPLNAGNYTCTITDANGCTAIRNISINQPSTLSASNTQGNISCNGGTTTATVTANGGTSPYAYSWSPIGGSGATSTALGAGSYSCTITDVNGCTTVRSITLTQPSALSATSTQGSISCNAGTTTASITPNGGTSPYTFSWSPIGGSGATSAALGAGSYSCTVTDVNGCTTVRNITLSQPSVISATSTQGTIACNGGNTTATVSANGGTSPYTYSWSPTGGNGSISNPISAGSYSCTITDINGCTTVRNIIIAQPSALSVSSTQGVISCNGGTATATVAPNGGTAPFTFAWSPTGGVSATSAALIAGSYSCTITDANGCSTVRNISLTQPTILTVNVTSNVSSCGLANGSATATASGGTQPYNYSWNPSGINSATASGLIAGSYSVSINDANGCTTTATTNVTNVGSPNLSITNVSDVTCFGSSNGSASIAATGGVGPYMYSWTPSGGNAASANALAAGGYSILVTGANGCTASISLSITQPAQLALLASATSVSCFGGSNGVASVSVIGGTSPYLYSWSSSGGSNASINNLIAGNYSCLVTDAQGCTATASTLVSQPNAISIIVNTTDLLCFNGSTGTATAIVSGGVPAYQYAWAGNLSTNSSIAGLSAQQYNCTITDANGCSQTQSFSIGQPTPLQSSISVTDAHCGQSDGSIVLNVSGGIQPYAYSWSPSGSSSSLVSIAAGVYNAIITDLNGCTTTASATVIDLPGVIASLGNTSNVTCFGGADGTATVLANGGSLPYAYSWSPNVGAAASVIGLSAGAYQVTVTDANGCSSIVGLNITEPPQLMVNATVSSSTVCPGIAASLTATASGGLPIYNYVWSPGNLAGAVQALIPQTSTNYTVLVTDANGCTQVGSANVNVAPLPQAGISVDINAACAPVCVQFSDNSMVNSPGLINSWSWNFGDGTTSTNQNPSHCFDDPGSYDISLTVLTSDGCVSTLSTTDYIHANAVPVASFIFSPTSPDAFYPQVSFVNNSVGASSWFWNFGDLNGSTSAAENPIFLYPDTSCFTVTLIATSDSGCVDTTMEIVCIKPVVTVYVPNAFTPNGDGVNDLFYPVCMGLSSGNYSFWIYDRWGQTVFFADKPLVGWDGKYDDSRQDAQMDAYVWRLSCKDFDGRIVTKSGRVTLVR